MGLISVDELTFTQTAGIFLKELGNYGKQVNIATNLALVNYCEYLLSLMQDRIHNRSGFLRDSGHVTVPVFNSDNSVSCSIVWDAVYALIQDKGGFIVPKISIGMTRGKHPHIYTKRLFIPKRPGVYPIQDPALRKAMGWRINVDFVLTTKPQIIDGNRYISDVLQRELPNAERTVGRFVEQMIGSGKPDRTQVPADDAGLLGGTGGLS